MMKGFFAILLAALLLLSSCAERALLTYEEYWALSGDEQLEYKESFKSPEEFYAWYDDAKQEYISSHPGTGAGDGEIDISNPSK